MLTGSLSCSSGSSDTFYDAVDVVKEASLALGSLPLDEVSIVFVIHLCCNDRAHQQEADSGLPQ